SRFTQFSAYTKRFLSGLPGRLPPNFTHKGCRQSKGIVLFNMVSCCRRITCCYEEQWRFDTAAEIYPANACIIQKLPLMYRRKKIPAIGLWSNKVGPQKDRSALNRARVNHEGIRSGTNRKLIRKTPPRITDTCSLESSTALW